MNTKMPAPLAEADRVNDATGFRFVRALAVERAALDGRLPPAAIRVLAAISYFMHSETKRSWPEYRHIAEVTGYSEDSIKTAIAALKQHGYILTERRAPITGGPARVHYALARIDLADLDRIVTAAVKEFRQNLTVAKTTRSGLTVAKTTRSAISPPTKSKPSEADRGKNYPVRLTVEKITQSEPHRVKNSTVRDGADRVIFSDHSLYPSVENITAIASTGRDLLGDDPNFPGLDVPSAIQEAIASGKAKVAGKTLVDAVKAARKRNVDPTKIEISLRKALAAAAREFSDRDPPPGVILSRATYYVERSDSEAMPSSDRPATGPRALLPKREFAVPAIDDLPSIHDGGWED